MLVKTTSILALTLLFACGSDDSSQEAKSERVSSKSTYSTDNDRIELASEINLTGQNSGCSFTLPKDFVYTPSRGFSYGLGNRMVFSARKQLRTIPTETRLTDSLGIDGEYEIELDKGTALLNFNEGNLLVTLTCAY